MGERGAFGVAGMRWGMRVGVVARCVLAGGRMWTGRVRRACVRWGCCLESAGEGFYLGEEVGGQPRAFWGDLEVYLLGGTSFGAGVQRAAGDDGLGTCTAPPEHAGSVSIPSSLRSDKTQRTQGRQKVWKAAVGIY